MKNVLNKDVSSRFRLLFILVMVGILSWACSYYDPVRMVPPLSPQTNFSVGHSLHIKEVTGGMETTFGGTHRLSNEDLKQALVLTLKNSGLFNEVSSESGDIKLYASIRSQHRSLPRGSVLEYRSHLTVSYRFLDQSGEIIWLETYDSAFSSMAFSGDTRGVEAIEGSVRENLSLLIQGITERWPKHK